MSVKRYDSNGFESEYGVWVRAVDYDALVEQHSKSDSTELRAYAHKFRDWIADQIEAMEESYDRDGAPEQSAALHRAVEFIRASEANSPPKPGGGQPDGPGLDPVAMREAYGDR